MNTVDLIKQFRRENKNPPKPGEKTITQLTSESGLSRREVTTRVAELVAAGKLKQVTRKVQWANGLRDCHHYIEVKPCSKH